MKTLPGRTVLLALALLAARPAPAAGLSRGPGLVSGGGGLSAGPRFSAAGSVGQPAAGVGFTSDAFRKRGGFWCQILPWINVPPAPADDLLMRRPGEAAHVLISTLLGNDADADYDPLAFAGFLPASAGGGTLERDGPWLIYSPPAGAAPDATDSFTYFVTDGAAPPVPATVHLLRFVPGAAGSSAALAVEFDPGPPALARLRFHGLPGRTYRVEAAAEVTGPWLDLGPVTAGPTGRMLFTEAGATGPRFYRLTEPSP